MHASREEEEMRLLMLLFRRRRLRRKRKISRKVWVRKMLRMRGKQGAFQKLVKEMRASDREAHFRLVVFYFSIPKTYISAVASQVACVGYFFSGILFLKINNSLYQDIENIIL